MTDKEFLDKITALCDEYETSHKNEKIIGVYVDFDGAIYEWTGQDFVNEGACLTLTFPNEDEQ